MKLYISGPMRGRLDQNRGAFAEATHSLRTRYYQVFNPHELPTLDKNARWHHYLRRDIKHLVDCDAIVVLTGWEGSDGARLEVEIGLQLGMPIYRMKNDRLELMMHMPTRAEVRC